MRELVTLIVCAAIFLIALQSGVIKTGLDYETVLKNNETLQSSNERLTQEIKRLNELGGKGRETAFSSSQITWLEKTEKIKEEIKKQLNREIQTREVVLNEDRGEIHLILLDKLLFKKHADEILKSSQALLLKIAGILNGLDQVEIVITGHTDSEPLSADMARKYPSLRHLSVARAAAVADFFQKTGHLDPVQMLVGGYGEMRPVVPNDSDYHRALNGRIEISFNPVNGQTLNNAREIFRTELLLPNVEGGKKNGKRINHGTPEPNSSEPVGEEELQKMNGTDFNAGYEKPAE